MVRKTTITTTTITKRHHEGHVPLFVDDQGRPLTDDRSARTSAGIVSGMREGRIDDDDDDGGGGVLMILVMVMMMMVTIIIIQVLSIGIVCHIMRARVMMHHHVYWYRMSSHSSTHHYSSYNPNMTHSR